MLGLERGYWRWSLAAASTLALTSSIATSAATTPTRSVPPSLLGVWHKTMTKAQWEHAGVSRDAGVYTFVVKKTGLVTIYRPGDYRAGCNVCSEDFTTTFRPNGGRLTLGSVPVCSFPGVYSWRLSTRALTLTPVADKNCVVRATFFGGRWQR